MARTTPLEKLSIPFNSFRYHYDCEYEDQVLLQQSQEYIESYKKVYDSILYFIENQETNDDDFNDLIKIINIQLNGNKQEELHFLYMIQYISNNHHRDESLFDKIFKIILYYSNQIKKSFSNIEIFDIFKKNIMILLFLFDNKIIDIDENIFQLINNTFEKNGNCYSYFFYPEIQNYLDEKSIKDIDEILLAKDDNIFENFEQNRHKGENHSYICSLIRQDSVEEFIAYINRNNISLNSSIVHSIFETNSFLIKKTNISLIEYAAFFGSIQIYQYLCLNNVKIPFNLLNFAIHSKNAELFHLIEFDTNAMFNIINCYHESIKCHHNDMAEYIKNNLFDSNQFEHNYQSKNTFYFVYKYHNFSNFPNFPNFETDEDFFYLSKYGYTKLASICLKQKVKHIKNVFIKNDNIVKLRNDSNFKVLFFYYFMSNELEFDFIDHKNNCVIDKIVIPSSIYYIYDDCFDQYISLTQISIPSSITSIGKHAFNGCSSLKQITIPSSVTSIGKHAFNGCSSLKQIIIPSSVTSIGNDSFCNCCSLTQITILSFITSINLSVFYLCRSLTQILIPSSVICIKDNAFRYCFSLTKVLFANKSSLELIGKNAFHKCTSLKNISFPLSVKIIENYAFSDCKSLIQISIPSANKIGSYAFKECYSLVQIQIPSSVTEIGESAFEGCSSLEQIKVPSFVTEVGNQASEG